MVKYPAPPTHSILPRDRLERRWGLFVGASLFYAVVIAAFMAFVLLCEYPNVVEAANGTEEIIQVIHDTVFEKRWIAYLLLAVAVSPWVIAWGEVHIGLSSSDDEEGNTRLLIAYFIMVMIVGPLLAYLWQPKHLSIDWGNGICFLQGGQSSVYREVVDHLPLIILTSLLALTLYCVIFGNYPTREDAEGETVLASGALLIATTHLLLALTHDFSFTWTACALLSLPTTLLFVGSVIWARQDKLEWYVPLLSFVIFIGWMGVLLTWALTEEYSVAWILIVIAGLAGVLLLVTTAVVSRDKTRVKEVIEEFLQHTPDIDLPRVGLKLIKQPYANTNWVVVNIIIDTLSIIAVALINTIARAGHFLINRVIMPSLEAGLYSLLWLLTQLFNLLLIFFAHLVFAITIIPEFLLEVAVIILDALEINLRLVFFQIITLVALAASLAVSIHLTIDYFLVGDKWLIAGIAGAGLAGVFSIVYSLSSLFRVSFAKALDFYLRRLSEILSYCLLFVCIVCWLVIWLSPKFGVEHFKPGLVTWLSTTLILLAIPFAYLCREKNA